MHPAKTRFLTLIIGSVFIINFSISCRKNQAVPKVQTWSQKQTTGFTGEGRQAAVSFSIGSNG